MNERIKELAFGADFLGKKHNGAEFRWGYIDPALEKKLDKFAELIVQECFNTIKKDMELAHIQLIPIDFGIYANGRLRRIIKEHFGVEE